MAGRYRLEGGSHTRDNGEKIHAGQTFEPTTEELEGPLRDRVSPDVSVHTMPPGYDRIDWDDDGADDEG